MTAMDIFMIIFLGLMVGSVIFTLVSLWVSSIRYKKHLKWAKKMIAEYPELKNLLSVFCSRSKEGGDTIRELVQLRGEIDKAVEKMKYLPRGHKMERHIENLRKHYDALDTLRNEQYKEKCKAEEAVAKWWETNFPDVPEKKRIMWWE